MAEMSSLLAILQLPEESANVRSVLIKSLALDDAEKASRRISVAEKLFPLVCGNDATQQSEANFSEQRETTWSTNCRLTPRIVVTPQTPQDVGKALALCRFLGIRFSVRSGGHIHNPGFTSTDGGVVLLMKKFNTTTLSEDRATADITMNYHKANEKDSKANILCFFIKDTTMVVLSYTDPVVEKPAVFNSFDGIECASRVALSKIYTVYDMWSRAEDESIILEASRKIIDQAEAVAKENGTYIDFKYSNYALRDQDPLATYGPDNVEKLRSIAKEVDPQDVFQELQNDGWLLSKTASMDTQTRS
ncbi:FAD-bindingtype 2 [Penicillium sp. IBT 31633x]|nr:FAD-bindingtype 2 [Penicillium sp. IBT 31633x]